MSTFAISCLGCKVNTYEAESICASLKEMGLEEVSFQEEADVYCIFTCAVTNTAASKSRQKIHQAIRKNPDALICVVGCYVQINAEQLKEDEHIDILVGSSGKKEVPALIQAGLINKKKQVIVDDVRNKGEFEALPLHSFTHMTRAYLKVQDGCNQFCSYCIIPYARGKERCLDLNEAIEQTKELSKHHEEIVLAGIHTGRYGKDAGVTLADLIQGMLEKTTIQRIRISSIEITEITDELIELMKKSPRVARHLHIPIQSGCNETLKRMNRPYTIEEFLKRIEWIRSEIPDITISTDLIVGFPGETEEQFEITKKTLYQAEFFFLHVFPFSSKSGTAASRMKDHVSNEIKKQRVNECLAISSSLKVQAMSRFINKTVEVLIEKTEDGYSFGHTSEYIPFKIKGEYPSGTMIKAVGSAIMDEQLYGKEE